MFMVQLRSEHIPCLTLAYMSCCLSTSLRTLLEDLRVTFRGARTGYVWDYALVHLRIGNGYMLKIRTSLAIRQVQIRKT